MNSVTWLAVLAVGCGSSPDGSDPVCMPDGVCVSKSEVAWVVEEGADNSTCSEEFPCAHVMAGLGTRKLYILTRGTLDGPIVADGGRKVTIVGKYSTILTRGDGVGSILTVRGDETSVSLYDLYVSDLTDSHSVAIQLINGSLSLTNVMVGLNTGAGIDASAGHLSVVSSSILQNHKRGIIMDGVVKFQIVNTIFVGNGDSSTYTGALEITTYESPQNLLEFNTFYRNQASPDSSFGSAAYCVAGVFTARNNIFVENSEPALGGDCSHTFSIVNPEDPPSGTGNLHVDPKFVDPMHRDFHLVTGSPATGAADPATDLEGIAASDRDRVPRAVPASIGAYEGRLPAVGQTP